MTLRNCPTSECTPKAAPWVFAMMTSLALNRDVAGRETVDADDGADHRNGKDDPFDRGEDALVLLPPRPEVECSTGGVEAQSRLVDCRIATVYTAFIIFAGGMKFLLLSAIRRPEPVCFPSVFPP